MHWVERVGLDTIKAKVVDDLESRKALYERLLYALSGEKDPWGEIVGSAEKRRQFEPLAV